MPVAGLLSILIFTVLPMAGMVLLAVGLVGRRVNDHDHCRACGYDLFGSEAGACPECGADLSKPRAIRHGRRARRPRVIASAMTLLALWAAFVGTAWWARAKAFNWNTVKPVWMLTLEAQNGHTREAPAAVAELLDRLKHKRLTADQTQALMARALAVQADSAQPWHPEWGDLIEYAHSTGTLSAEQWKTYVRDALDVRLRVRPRIRRGDNVPMEILVGRGRAGPGPLVWVTATWAVEPQVNGQTLDPAVRPGQTINRKWSIRQPLTAPAASLPHLPDGLNTCRATLKVNVRDGPSAESPLLMEFDAPVEATFTLLPPDQPSATPVREDSGGAGSLNRATILRWLKPRVVNINDPIPSWPYTGVYVVAGEESASVGGGPATPGVAFDVIIRSGEREWPVGSLAQGRAQGRWSVPNDRHTLGRLDLDAPTVDVIFRPSPKAAAETLGVLEYWDGEFVFKDVPVRYSPGHAATRPATRPATQPATTAGGGVGGE